MTSCCSRDILNSALVLNDIHEIGLDYQDLISEKHHQRFVSLLEMSLYEHFNFDRNDLGERDLIPQEYYSYGENESMNMNSMQSLHMNYNYNQPLFFPDFQNNNQSKTTFSNI